MGGGRTPRSTGHEPEAISGLVQLRRQGASRNLNAIGESRFPLKLGRRFEVGQPGSTIFDVARLGRRPVKCSVGTVRRYSERLVGMAVIWAAVWAGTAVLLGGSAEFGQMIPLLLMGTAGTLIVASIPEATPCTQTSSV